jgi:hypothetical protein
MTELERIRREIRAELAARGDPNRDEPELDPMLEAALPELDPTDVWIDAIATITQTAPLASTAAEAFVRRALDEARKAATAPEIRIRRERSGLGMVSAARALGITPRALEELEQRRPLGWLQVSSGALAAYLDRLHLPRGEFVRWVASLMLARQPGHAYGYRPREAATAPVDTTPSAQLLEDFRRWASEVLNAQ